MAEYLGAARSGVSPNKSVRVGTPQLFIAHHYASTQDPESAWQRFMSPNDRGVSPNWQVNADGSVYECVPPTDYRAWTTGAIDHFAVTAETQNTSTAPTWGISAASHEALAQLFAWSHQRYGIPLQRGRVDDGNVIVRGGLVGHNETPAGRVALGDRLVTLGYSSRNLISAGGNNSSSLLTDPVYEVLEKSAPECGNGKPNPVGYRVHYYLRGSKL